MEETLQSVCESLVSLTSEFGEESQKNLAGNKSAGARARKLSIEIERNLKLFRKLSIEANKQK